MVDKYMSAIKSAPLFNGIPQDELRSMFACLKPRFEEHPKASIIAAQGQPLERLGLLLHGSANINKEDYEGNGQMLGILEPGEIFGEMAAFGGGVWPATVTATEPCAVMFILPQSIVGGCANACTSHRRLTENMLHLLAGKALALTKKVEYLSIKSMRGRISAYLLDRAAGKSIFDLNVNRNEMAQLLGVSRPSMSRELGRMQDEGIIEFYRSSVKIKNAEALRYAAGK